MAHIPKVILWIENSREFGRQLLRGISMYANLYDPWNFYTTQPFYYKKSGDNNGVLAMIKKWDADGVIMRESADVERIREKGVPAVVCTYTREKIPGLVSLVGDCAGAGRLAAEHLLERGFKQFAYCGLENMYWSRERGESFRQRVAKAGYEVHFYKQPALKKQRFRENEQAVMADWLKNLPKPIGLMTCADDRSQNIIEACKIAGLHVPEELAVIGVDNDELVCNLSNPPLSSVVLNAVKAGYEAAEMLHKLMNGEKDTDRVITAQATHVAARQSTDILAIEDHEIANAVKFIRENAKREIQVGNVAEYVVLSQRALQQRFRKILGRTIHDEINRVRFGQICQLLLETRKSIGQIAIELGFSGDDHIARYFRKEKGISPCEYRRQFGQDFA
jgi:LacI family transcriptional regulator